MNKEKTRLIITFLIPVVVFFLFELFFKKFENIRLFNAIENLLFASILVIISIFINKLNFKTLYLQVTYFFFCFSLLFETVYYYNFDTIFSSSAIFVIIETNLSEAKEFIASYLNNGTLSLFFLFILTLILGLIKIENYKKKVSQITFNKIKGAVLLLCILTFLKLTKLIIYNVPYLIIKTATQYYQETQMLNVYGKENPIGHFTNVKRTKHSNKKELYIIVIGESTSKLHFKLYNNYYRETTPLLDSLRDELVICHEVISPHAYTIGSLTKGLTLGNFENPEARFNGSIIQLLNQANFKTYWISNQRPIGISDTQVTKIGSGASKSIYLNIKHTSEQTPFDQVLVDELENVVKEEGDKKVVFLHMIGAHISYEKRYPENFNYFRDTPKTKFKSESVYKEINAYDNVIRYTDYILNQIVELTKKQNSSSFVLYFSDHGQEVYDDIYFLGQSVDKIVTKNMYEIPMFLWQSNQYKKGSFIQKDINKKYMTDDMIHTIADLCHVKSNEIDSTRSIFNSAFKERKRIIKENLDFDEYFKANDKIN